MNEFIEQFLLESRELVEQGMRDLLALEHRPGDKELLDSAFRAFHTLKGGAGIVDFVAMTRALHAAEDVLAAVRAGDRPITARLVGDCLASLDQVTQWLDAIEARGGVLPTDVDAGADAVITRFAAEPVSLPESAQALSPSARTVLDAQLLLLAETGMDDAAGRITAAARVAANVLRRTARPQAAEAIEEALRRALQSRDPAMVAAAIAQYLPKAAIPEPKPSSIVDPARQETAARTIRVDVERVDALVDLTGELMIAKNALGHLAKLAQDGENALAPALRGQHALIDRLIGSLQHSVLTMRVLPLRLVFQRFPRLVREMAQSLGKPCRLVTEGDETEADKAIVEALYEPLLHILRNAMDHGVETVAQRAARGKPGIATIHLRGSRQGEHVLIEVADDGGGIDIAKVRAVASARGIASDETLAGLTDAETINLIFEPGFSTAATVTGFSGRGVGMDAVRAAVERLGGRVSVESRQAIGSTIRFDLPFSIMTTQIMTVEAGGQMFGIPLDAVIETLRVGRDRISPIGAAQAFVWRNRTVPVIDLQQALRREAGPPKSSQPTLVIVAFGGQFGALEVDRIGERLEVILKPMAGLLSQMPGVSGTTLLGDGNVLLVLDIEELLS